MNKNNSPVYLSYRLVDEVMPLGEDRKTVFVPEPPVYKLRSQIENFINQTNSDMFSLAAILISVLVEKYGDDVWAITEKVMYDIGFARGPEFAATMKIDPTDARSVGRVLDLEDSRNGVRGEWIETGKKRAVKREYYCPLAERAAICQDICPRLFIPVERGTFDAIGAKVNFTIIKLMPKGDPYCEAVIELE